MSYCLSTTKTLTSIRRMFHAHTFAVILSLLVCSSLFFSSLILAKPLTEGSQGQTRRGRPEASAPAALAAESEVRRKHHPRPETHAAISSLTRSRRKPLLPRNGRKVGDALTGSEANGVTQSLPAVSGKRTIPDSAVVGLGKLSASHARLQATPRHHSSNEGKHKGAGSTEIVNFSLKKLAEPCVTLMHLAEGVNSEQIFRPLT